MGKTFRTALLTFLISLSTVQPILAAPHFILSGRSTIPYLGTNSYSIYLTTDSETVTAAQAVISFDSTRFEGTSFSMGNSRCRMWSPANPSLGLGNNTTPYFYQNSKFVFSCGFPDGGYTSSSATGDLIATFSLKSIKAQNATTNLTFNNQEFYYIGSPIPGGTSASLTLTTSTATEAATPTPMPTPTIEQDTLRLDDMAFSEISTQMISSSSARSRLPTRAATSSSSLTARSQLDDSIPTPPALTPRATEAPLVLPTTIPAEAKTKGDVLSVQSLRELFLPGKSNANQTIVLFNLISLLTFLVILTILVWRLIAITRLNKLKQRHMKELIAGELSVLESKLASDAKQPNDVAHTLESLKEKFDKS